MLQCCVVIIQRSNDVVTELEIIKRRGILGHFNGDHMLSPNLT